MMPIRASSIYRSRWTALLCGAGLIWLLLRATAPDQPADLTGATISDDQANSFAQR